MENYKSLFDISKGPIVGLPTYVPQGYSLQCISVSGANPSEEDAVSFYYFKDDKEFQSRFLPKIEYENETDSYPMYAKWFPEFYNAGGIVITRSIEYIDEHDPRYNDKLKHFEIERATGDPRNNCALIEYTRGDCTVDLQGVYPPVELANGNPIHPTFVQQSGDRTDGMLMYMDHNWLVYLIGNNDPELFKMAETIHQIGDTEMNRAQSINNQTSKYARLTQEESYLVNMSKKQCDDKVAVVRLSGTEGKEAISRLEANCEKQEAKQISLFLSSTPHMTVVNGTIQVKAGGYILYPISIPQNSTDVELTGSHTSNGSGINILFLDDVLLDLWKNGVEFGEPRVSATSESYKLDTVTGKTVYLVFDNTTEHELAKEVKAQFTITYTKIPKE